MAGTRALDIPRIVNERQKKGTSAFALMTCMAYGNDIAISDEMVFLDAIKKPI
jgi:hypothetical protein